MQVGMLMVFQNFEDGTTDQGAWERDIHIGSLAEPLGFDYLSSVEHHFFNYAMCPDNLEYLSYMAAKTERIGLLTGAVILPWNNPLRVVERMITLDHLSRGRALFGIGRGLSRREYEPFGVDMSESRERFDEAAEMIVRGLETGVVEGDGLYYPQKRTEVRPRPYASFKDRFYAVGMSSDSVPVVARLGAKMMTFGTKPWEETVPHFNRYRDLYREHHNTQPPSPVCVDFLFCDESAELAESMARKHISNYFISIMEHYELANDHFREMKGYGDYADNAQLLRDANMDEAANGFVDINTWGSPRQMLEKLEDRRRVLGDYDLCISASYGGLTTEQSEQSLRLFAEEVMPELQSWQTHQFSA